MLGAWEAFAWEERFGLGFGIGNGIGREREGGEFACAEGEGVEHCEAGFGGVLVLEELVDEGSNKKYQYQVSFF